jgi:hypothetical protein
MIPADDNYRDDDTGYEYPNPNLRDNLTIQEMLDLQIFEARVRTLTKEQAQDMLIHFMYHWKSKEKFFLKALKEHWGL